MPRRRSAFTLVEVIVVVLLLAFLVALLLPAVQATRTPSRSISCRNNLKLLGLALHNYHDTNGELPPAYTVDADGNRLHSWRTLLLPFLEEKALFDTIDLTKPWDDPANAAARETALQVFRCPSAEGDARLTNYVAVVGPGCLLSGSDQKTFDDVTDGLSQTLWLVEVPSQHAVHWMAPEDITPEELLEILAAGETNHPGGINVGYADGRIEFLPVDTSTEQVRARLTIAGGEEIGEIE